MKIVMVVNNELTPGLIANTTAVLGVSLGNRTLDIVGDDCKDSDNCIHKGITKVSIPVLSSTGENLREIYLGCLDNSGIEMIGFNKLAQSCRNYEDYRGKLGNTKNGELQFSGICIFGNRKTIDGMTGSLSLL